MSQAVARTAAGAGRSTGIDTFAGRRAMSPLSPRGAALAAALALAVLPGAVLPGAARAAAPVAQAVQAAPMAGPGGIRLRGAPGVLPDFYRSRAPESWRWAGPNPYAAGR
ncbi:MAG TPA: hypothetical protein VMB84_09570 [Stellaceae bacterium]|nr:hypothetical protein [Stellaceae bacterium]